MITSEGVHMKKIILAIVLLSLVACSKPETTKYDQTICTLGGVDAEVATELVISSDNNIIKKIDGTATVLGSQEEIDASFIFLKMVFGGVNEFKGISATTSRESSTEVLVKLSVDYDKLDMESLKKLAKEQNLPFEKVDEVNLDGFITELETLDFTCKR